MGGTGKAASAIKVDEAYHTELKTLNLIPGGQTKQSFVVKKIIDLYMTNATAFENLVTEYAAHTAKAGFISAAATLGLVTFDIAYKSTSSTYEGGLMVYVLAKLAIQLSFTGSPYDTALASWTATEIGEMVTDLNG